MTALEIAETIEGWDSEETKQGKAEVAALLRSAAEPRVRVSSTAHSPQPPPLPCPYQDETIL